MRMENKSGEAVYYNVVEKGGKLRFVIKAASGQVITGRDRQKLKSRTFTQYSQAEAYLKRHGFESETYK